MTKIKWNYAVVKTVFNTYWVGKTKLTLKSDKIFAKFEDAMETAEDMFKSDHPDFDEDKFDSDEEGNDFEEGEAYRDLTEDKTAENAEEIGKKIEHFIVGVE